MSMLMSIIICAKEKPLRLERVLHSLRMQQDCLFDWEVVVVDDASVVNLSTVCKKSCIPVIYIRNPISYGISASRNLAIKAASGDVLLFTDSDCVFSKCTLSAHVDAWTRSTPPLPLFVIGDHYEVSDLSHENLEKCWQGENALCSFDSWTLKSYAFYKTVQQNDWLCFFTKNLSAKTEDIVAVGGFDEKFSGWGFEDVDLGIRLVQAFSGRSFLRLCSAATVYHQAHEGSRVHSCDAVRNFRRLKLKYKNLIPQKYFEYICGSISFDALWEDMKKHG